MAGGVAHDTHRRLSSRNAASSSSFIVAKGCGMACDKFCRFHKVRALFPTVTRWQFRVCVPERRIVFYVSVSSGSWSAVCLFTALQINVRLVHHSRSRTRRRSRVQLAERSVFLSRGHLRSIHSFGNDGPTRRGPNFCERTRRRRA